MMRKKPESQSVHHLPNEQNTGQIPLLSGKEKKREEKIEE